MQIAVQFRWLGVAGIEITAGDEVLVIDPHFTRFPCWRQWIGRVRPNAALTAEKVPRCNYVLVSHAHWDHLMDAPDVMRNTGAVAMGSPNACRLLALDGIPAERIRRIEAGETLTLGSFRVEVIPARHLPLPLDHLFSGPLRAGLHPPLRALDYKMDSCFSFRIRAGGVEFLNWRSVSTVGAVPADVLFVSPTARIPFYQSLLGKVQPRVVVPVHWDDFYRPLSKPIRPMLTSTGKVFPRFKRLDIDGFEGTIARVAPGARVVIPEAFRVYDTATPQA